MTTASGLKEICRFDCPGGGQIWVEGTTAFVGHMQSPSGTTILDVADPKRPRQLARIDVAPGTHSHKVRVRDGLMVVNHERIGSEQPSAFGGGIGIYDVANPAKPRLITTWNTAGKGVHRFDFDGRHAYLSATVDGYIGNIVVILDLSQPARPTEVGRWWIEGQWQGGGEAYPWDDWTEPRCHHPLRLGDRLYVSYWHHGFFILDIEEISKPKLVSGFNTTPVYPHPTHTALPVPRDLQGRRILIVADEDVAKLWPHPPSFTWMFDITVETSPLPIATFRVDGVDTDGAPQQPMTGCHQPSERFEGTESPFAWFAQGLRIVDIADPYRPAETAYFRPDPPDGCARLCSNDVTIDDRGLIYLLDRQRGLHIIERT